MATPRTTAYRRNNLWLAAMIHRVSGILLACFLPVHFLVLGLALQGAAALDGFLAWTRSPLVKLVETLLVALLAVHLLGGLRVLVIENLPWRDGQKRMATMVLSAAAVIGLLFLIRIG